MWNGRHLLALVLLLVPVTRAVALDSAPNTLSAAEQAAGWKLLFDGKTTQGWRSFAGAPAGAGWKVENGELTRAEKGAGDILTDGEYDAFEMVVDYKISPGGNSGLMYHVTDAGKTPWQTGPEIQIQDNKDGHDPQLAGWLYQLYKPETDATRPAGEWNQIRILVTPQKCATWMNGTLYYEYVKGSKDWDERVAKSKFASMPHFGKPTSGRICLQDHGNVVSFRNIKIRLVSPAPTVASRPSAAPPDTLQPAVGQLSVTCPPAPEARAAACRPRPPRRVFLPRRQCPDACNPCRVIGRCRP